MKTRPSTFLVLGATGRTGKHFVTLALEQGHIVKAIVRDPAKMKQQHTHMDVIRGSITSVDDSDIDEWLHNVDGVICMLGDAQQQQREPVNTIFIKKLIPAMRRQGIKTLLYQAGGFTRPYKERLPWMTWILKQVLVRSGGLIGQHKDNESVIEYLVEEAQDIDWIVHRACISSDGATKGTLKRDHTKFNIATFADCAAYSYRLLYDESAIHSCDLSYYDTSS